MKILDSEVLKNQNLSVQIHNEDLMIKSRIFQLFGKLANS